MKLVVDRFASRTTTAYWERIAILDNMKHQTAAASNSAWAEDSGERDSESVTPIGITGGGSRSGTFDERLTALEGAMDDLFERGLGSGTLANVYRLFKTMDRHKKELRIGRHGA
jgi:hypothetical protein